MVFENHLPPFFPFLGLFLRLDEIALDQLDGLALRQGGGGVGRVNYGLQCGRPLFFREHGDDFRSFEREIPFADGLMGFFVEIEQAEAP
jgi:hypothetical protein